MAGTGLPIPKTERVLVQPGQTINADAYSNAQSWAQIAQAGARIGDAAGDYVKIEMHQAKVGHLAESDTKIRRERIEAEDRFANNPEGFDAHWTGLKNGIIGAAEPWAVPHITRQLGSEGNSAYAAILGRRRSEDHRLDGQRVNALGKQVEDDVLSFAAASGDLSTPDGKALLVKYKGVLDSAVSSRLIPQEEADLKLENLTLRANQEVIRNKTEEVYRAYGFEGAREFLTSQVKSLGTKFAVSDKIERSVMAWLRTEEAGLRGEREAVGRDWAAAKGQASTLAPDVLIEMRNRAASLGAFRVATDIETQIGAMDKLRSVRGMPVEEQVRIAKTGVISEAYINRLIGSESGNDPLAKNKLSSARGLGQFTDGTWLAVLKRNKPELAAGKSDTEILALRNDGDLSREMTRIFTVENRGHLAASGVSTGDAALHLAHFLGAGGAVGVLKADPNTPIRNLVSEGAFAANQEVFGKNQTAGAVIAWAERKQGGSGGGGGGDAGVDLTQSRSGLVALGLLKKELAAGIKDDLTNFKSIVDRGQTQSPADLEALGGKVEELGTEAQRTEFAELSLRAKLGIEFSKLSDLKRAEGLTAVRERMKNAATRFNTDVEAHLTKADATITKAYQEDKYGAHYRFAEGAEPLPSIDWANPAQAAAIMREKVKQQATIRADQGLMEFSVLRPEESASVATMIRSGDKGAGQAIGMIAALPPDIYRATMGDKAIVEALSGASRSSDPARVNMAMSAMDQLWQSNKLEFANAFKGDAIERLKEWQINERYMKPEEFAKHLQRREEPQAQKIREKNEADGRAEATKMTADGALKHFDKSWTGMQPIAPTDSGVREKFFGDFVTLYGRYSAKDEATALKNTVEHMETKWSRSQANGGQLMLRAPEQVYAPIEGSHDWMQPQIIAAISEQLGPRFRKPGVGEALVAGATFQRPVPQWDYALVSDQQTDGEAQNYDHRKPVSAENRAPSYVVVVTDHTKVNPKLDVLKNKNGSDRRLHFNPNEGQQIADDLFSANAAVQGGNRGSLALPVP